MSPPPRLAVDRKVLPLLLALVTILVAALVAQAALDSALAGWVAVAGMPVVLVYGLALLAPASRTETETTRPEVSLMQRCDRR